MSKLLQLETDDANVVEHKGYMILTVLAWFWYAYDDWLAAAVGAHLVGELPFVLWILMIVAGVLLDRILYGIADALSRVAKR
jgi:hypothetical protein